MNEENTVLQFFAQEENLPLALIAAEHLDGIRLKHNNRFWESLRERIDGILEQGQLQWRCEFTEDRNTENCLVGVHLEPKVELRSFLRPFMEQQLIGDTYRIYYGLMWNAAPEPVQKNLPAVQTLQSLLSRSGFKQSDSFLAWQWSPWYPRRKDFLLRFSTKKDELLNETMKPWLALLEEYGKSLNLTNHALNEVPYSATISLDQLHSKSKNQTELPSG